jgi:hypothetical protein
MNRRPMIKDSDRRYINIHLPHSAKIMGIFLIFSLMTLSRNSWAYTSVDCVQCHAKVGSESKLQISLSDFKSSVHGDKVECSECHTGVVDIRHIKDPDLGKADCSRCHEQKNLHGMVSDSANRPRCYSCHTRHNILPGKDAASSVAPGRLRGTCGKCHPGECGKVEYLAWLPSLQISSHKKQDFAHSYGRDDCLGCHQGRAAHGEKGQIVQEQCYRCHLSSDGSGSALMGSIHPIADFTVQPATFTSAVIYQLFLAMLLIAGIMFYIGWFSGRKK